MVDSVSVAGGGEVAAWVTDVVVVEDAGGEGEQAQRDAGGQAFRVRPPWASRVSWPLQVQKTDSIHWRIGAEGAVAEGFVVAVGTQEVGVQAGHERFEFLAGEALVGEHGVAVKVGALGASCGADAFAEVGREQLEADRHAVGRAEQVEPEPQK